MRTQLLLLCPPTLGFFLPSQMPSQATTSEEAIATRVAKTDGVENVNKEESSYSLSARNQMQLKAHAAYAALHICVVNASEVKQKQRTKKVALRR